MPVTVPVGTAGKVFGGSVVRETVLMQSSTSNKKTTRRREISASLIRTVCRRLSQNKRVRRTLPGSGRLHIDRQLPFLCVYRRPVDFTDVGTDRLVKGEAAYLIAPGSARHAQAVSELVRAVAETMLAAFGAFLIVEIWAGADGEQASDPAVPAVPPKFQVVAPPSTAPAKTVDVLARRLRRLKVLKQPVAVEVVDEGVCAPPGMLPLFEPSRADEWNCSTIGLVVPPVYRDAKTGREFPLLMRQFCRSLDRALKQAFYEFAHSRTTHRPPHYHELGRRAVVKAVWEVDRRLGEVSSSFDFLLQVTPVNSDAAWDEFQRTHYERAPEFHYRPIPFDPAILKRMLYEVPVERVEDPALQHLFQEKQVELDRKITMLADRDTRRFLYGSLQLYGAVEDDLWQLAGELLRQVPQTAGEDAAKSLLSAEDLAQRARAEFEHYRAVHAEFTPKVEVTRRVAGVMVSRGTLLINRNLKVPPSRVEGLLHHEVGTHLLTYFNGRAQPFRQLSSGLAGYDALQEGLAVLAEYLAGGLSRQRMRQLAARVDAARMVIDGASFVDVFRALVRDHGFGKPAAYRISMRVFRGGGLTKDAVYLRGLQQMLRYVERNGELEPLLTGKMAFEHIPIIKELRFRDVLRPPPLRPRYLEDEQALGRLGDLRVGPVSVVELVESVAR